MGNSIKKGGDYGTHYQELVRTGQASLTALSLGLLRRGVTTFKKTVAGR